MRATQETVELWRKRLDAWKRSGKNIAKCQRQINRIFLSIFMLGMIAGM